MSGGLEKYLTKELGKHLTEDSKKGLSENLRELFETFAQFRKWLKCEMNPLVDDDDIKTGRYTVTFQDIKSGNKSSGFIFMNKILFLCIDYNGICFGGRCKTDKNTKVFTAVVTAKPLTKGVLLLTGVFQKDPFNVEISFSLNDQKYVSEFDMPGGRVRAEIIFDEALLDDMQL